MKRILCMAAAVLLVASVMLGTSAEARDVPEIIKSEDFRKLGLASFPFMKVSQTARAAAMGDAFAAVTDDINSIHFNPAGLVYVKHAAYQFSYTNWLVDTAFYSGAVAYNTPKGVIGVSFVSFDAGDMEERTIFSPQGTGEMINAGATAVGFAYAFRPTDKLGLGVRGVYVSETLHHDQMTSVMLDVGTHFYTGFRSARIALAMRNFGPDTKVLAADQKFLMPMNFDIGAAMEVYGTQDDPTYLTLSFESAYFVDYEQRWQVGGELWLANAIALRGGYKFNHDVEDFSLGAGFKTTFGERSVAVDVSYTNGGRLLSAPLRFSVGGTF